MTGLLFPWSSLSKPTEKSRKLLLQKSSNLVIEENMSVIDIILREHPEILDEMDELLDTPSEAYEERRRRFNEIAARIEAHERAEELTLYASLTQDHVTRQVAFQALEEHRLIRLLLQEQASISPQEEIWLPRMVVTRNLLSLHANIEENNVLPLADRMFSREDLDQMGRDFELTERSVIEGPQMVSCSPRAASGF